MSTPERDDLLRQVQSGANVSARVPDLLTELETAEKKAKLADELAERLETSHDSIIVLFDAIPEAPLHVSDSCHTCALLERYAKLTS